MNSRKQVLKKIDEIKRRGYAVSIQKDTPIQPESRRPVLGQTGIGSIAVIRPADRIEAKGIETGGKTVKRFADRLSTQLGYSQSLKKCSAGE